MPGSSRSSFDAIATHLPNFQGARRRFEHRGFYNDILFIDDYAHHPSEIRATLAAAQVQRSGPLPSHQRDRRVVAVFQPHRYSRAATLLSEFATAFEGADRVIVTDIYSAGETNTGRITGEQVAQAIASISPTEYYPTLDGVKQALETSLTPGDIVIFLTAGNLNQIIPTVMAAYQKAPQPEAALT